MTQAEENLGALGWRLSLDELLQLEYAAQKSPRRIKGFSKPSVGAASCRNIFQTM